VAAAGFLSRSSGREDRSSHESTIGFEQQRRLFEDGLFYHPDQKARFLFEAPRDLPEPPDKENPFLLLTGRGTSSHGTRRPARENPPCSKA
jgi:hypothetical protein